MVLPSVDPLTFAAMSDTCARNFGHACHSWPRRQAAQTGREDMAAKTVAAEYADAQSYLRTAVGARPRCSLHEFEAAEVGGREGE